LLGTSALPFTNASYRGAQGALQHELALLDEQLAKTQSELDNDAMPAHSAARVRAISLLIFVLLLLLCCCCWRWW
jgi:hypothetical protein